MSEPVDTRYVTDRRQLKFADPAGAIADAELIAASERAGTLRRAGNWEAGQVFAHLAAWMNYSFDGYPVTARPEHAAKAREALHTRVLDGFMFAGVRLPGVERGTAATERCETGEGLDSLRRAWLRVQASCPTQEHPFFGLMAHTEWIKLQLRHSELHQSFLHPA